MKNMIRYALLTGCAIGILTISNKLTAADDAMPAMSCCSRMATAAPMADSSTNAVPDLLPTCPVSGEKLNGDMGAPYVFSYQGQEVKLCCKSCKKDFDKHPAKYLKVIRAADQK